MADNYLEKKMEEHRQGGAPRRSPRLSPSGNRPGFLTIPFEPLSVAVVGDGDVARAIVKAYADASCRVAFLGADRRASTTFAQQSGSRYYPAVTVDSVAVDAFLRAVAGHFGHLDLVVDCRSIVGSVDCQPVVGNLSALVAELGASVIAVVDRAPVSVDMSTRYIVLPPSNQTNSAVAKVALMLSTQAARALKIRVFPL